MKLRIKGSSLRLRLSQADLEAFALHGHIEEAVRFPDGARLSYAVEASDEADELEAHFDGGRIVVRLPRAYATEWTDSDRVGFDAAHPLGEGGRLSILLEKDLGCKHKRPMEDDAIPQPSSDAG